MNKCFFFTGTVNVLLFSFHQKIFFFADLTRTLPYDLLVLRERLEPTQPLEGVLPFLSRDLFSSQSSPFLTLPSLSFLRSLCLGDNIDLKFFFGGKKLNLRIKWPVWWRRLTWNEIDSGCVSFLGNESVSYGTHVSRSPSAVISGMGVPFKHH